MGVGAGQIVEDADITAILRASSQRPVGRLVQTVSSTLADNTAVALTFTTEDIDTHGFHSTVSNTARVTPNVAGYYRFYGTAWFQPLATGFLISCHFRKNGTTALAPSSRITPPPGSAASQNTTILVEMNGTTDYVELMATQDSAGSDGSEVTGQFSSVLEWEYVRGL